MYSDHKGLIFLLKKRINLSDFREVNNGVRRE